MTQHFNIEQFEKDLSGLTDILRKNLLESPNFEDAKFMLWFFIRYGDFSLSNFEMSNPRLIKKIDTNLRSLSDILNTKSKIINFDELTTLHYHAVINNTINRINNFIEESIYPDEESEILKSLDITTASLLPCLLEDVYFQIEEVISYVHKVSSDKNENVDYEECVNIYHLFTGCANNIFKIIKAIINFNPQLEIPILLCSPHELANSNRKALTLTIRQLYEDVSLLGFLFGLLYLKAEDVYKYQKNKFKNILILKETLSSFSLDWLKILIDKLIVSFPASHTDSPEIGFSFASQVNQKDKRIKKRRPQEEYVDLGLTYFLYRLTSGFLFPEHTPSDYYAFFNLRKISLVFEPLVDQKLKTVYLVSQISNVILPNTKGKIWETGMLSRINIKNNYYTSHKSDFHRLLKEGERKSRADERNYKFTLQVEQVIKNWRALRKQGDELLEIL